MSKESYFIGEPVQFKPGILIYPPKVKDVITNQLYGHFGKLLTQSQEDIEDKFLEDNNPQEIYPTPFEALLNNCYHHKQFEKIAIAADEYTRKSRWDKIFLLGPHGTFVDDHERYMAHSGMKERQELYEILVKNLKESGNWDKVVILNGDYYENFMTVIKYVREVMAR